MQACAHQTSNPENTCLALEGKARSDEAYCATRVLTPEDRIHLHEPWYQGRFGSSRTRATTELPRLEERFRADELLCSKLVGKLG